MHTLDVSNTAFDDASLASLPRSVVSLIARECEELTPAAVLPPLPLLRLLDVSGTGIGDALVASLPPGLSELHMVGCRCVTAGATLDHVRALQVLHSYGTDPAPGVLDACRARGCAAPAAGVLRGDRDWYWLFELLADGRLVHASNDMNGEVWVTDMAASAGKGFVSFTTGRTVTTLAALSDGRRLAAGLYCSGDVVIWDVEVDPPVHTTTINCHADCSILALVALLDGRLAAGYNNGGVRIIDVDAGAVVATLEGHTEAITALAVLPDGTLASGSGDYRYRYTPPSGSRDCTVRLWDVGTQVCTAAMAGHTGSVSALAVLADGRLARGSNDHTVRLWDGSTRTCVSVLTGHTGGVSELVTLLDGRLVSRSGDGTVRVWDTRPAAAAAGSHAAGTAPMVTLAGGLPAPHALGPLPDGRLACTGGDDVYMLNVPPPVAYE